MFDPVEKNLLIGAFVTGTVDMALEAYYEYMAGRGTPPSGQFPYIGIHNALPPLDDWLTQAGVPLLFYALGKGMKKDSFVQMAKGGAFYGVPALLGQTIYRVVKESQTPTLTYMRVK